MNCYCLPLNLMDQPNCFIFFISSSSLIFFKCLACPSFLIITFAKESKDNMNISLVFLTLCFLVLISQARYYLVLVSHQVNAPFWVCQFSIESKW